VTVGGASLVIFLSEGRLREWRQEVVVVGLAWAITGVGFVAYSKVYADGATVTADRLNFLLA
jgi:hypothetical protein